jgi:hypothetical protein
VKGACLAGGVRGYGCPTGNAGERGTEQQGAKCGEFLGFRGHGVLLDSGTGVIARRWREDASASRAAMCWPTQKWSIGGGSDWPRIADPRQRQPAHRRHWVGGSAGNLPVWSDEICAWRALNKVLGPQPALLPDIQRNARETGGANGVPNR